MRFFKDTLLKLVELNLVFLLLMSAWRLIFFLYYGQGDNFLGLGRDIFSAFMMGFRFDLSVIAILNSVVVIIFIVLFIKNIPSAFKPFFSALKWFYTFFISLIFLILAIDFGFYSYFQDHINVLIFGFFEDDTAALISTIYQNYNVFIILGAFIVFCVIIFKLSKAILKIKTQPAPPKNIFVRTVASLIIATSLIIMMRGTVGDFPLFVHYGVSNNRFINLTALNGIFALQAAVESYRRDKKDPDYIEISGYKDNIRQAFADYLETDISQIPEDNPEDSLMVALPYNKDKESLKPNVIFIVMESLGTDLMKYNSETFNILGELKKHFDEDIVFYNFLPAYGSTVGSMEAVVSNIARRPGSIFLSLSPYVFQKYKFSGPLPYKQKGYETFFIYGGNSSWRNVEVFMTNLGFDKTIGEDGMKNKKYLGNDWGIFDEYLFDYVYEMLESNENSKFIYILSTTNHPPYSLPDNYEALSLEIPEDLSGKIVGMDLAQKRFKAYQYSARELGKFIERIKKSKYGENTIIAVTGDHNFKSIYSYDQSELFGELRVPFYLYIPKSLRPKNKIDTSVFGSHMDIMPTLYGLSLSDINYWAMGMDLLTRRAQNNIAVHIDVSMNSKYILVSPLGEAPWFYVWNKVEAGKVLPAPELAGHKRLQKHFLSMTAVSDYILKYTGKKDDSKIPTKH
ncbi:MAG: sulfatase-like hydrolase/transferase [Elusimicrobiota bacterium]|nr:sulfatase-like hydrolase/transferase [Elusimicrobiota bacterium]